MDKTFQPADIETKWYQNWEESGYFSPQGKGDAYSIMIPPPNVTGVLHMGHALNNTMQDIVARHRRMCGYDTLWLPGTDHAGIATQAVVEKRLLEEQNKTREELGRDAFLAEVWDWKERHGNTTASGHACSTTDEELTGCCGSCSLSVHNMHMGRAQQSWIIL